MKSTGIVRKVDELGRIVLPIELRRTLDIAERDELEIYLDDDKVVLKKYEPACCFCGEARDMVNFSGKLVCKSCIAKLNKAK
jgi:transcriptional pleiotropic regulator of transition state genes